MLSSTRLFARRAPSTIPFRSFATVVDDDRKRSLLKGKLLSRLNPPQQPVVIEKKPPRRQKKDIENVGRGRRRKEKVIESAHEIDDDEEAITVVLEGLIADDFVLEYDDRGEDNISAATKPILQRRTKRTLKATLVGLPNAGKSHLLNMLLGKSVSAVSSKSHTTRTQTLGVFTMGEEGNDEGDVDLQVRSGVDDKSEERSDD